MRIIYPTETNFSELGGHITHIIQFASALRKKSIQVVIVAPNLGEYGGDAPLEIRYLPCIKYRFLALLSFEFVLFFYLVFSRLRRKFDVVYVRSELYSLGATIYCSMFKCPLFVEVNSSKLDELKRRKKSELLQKIVHKIQGFNFRKADKIICSAKKLASSIGRDYALEDGSIAYVHNAADSEHFRPQPKNLALKKTKLGLPMETPIVGFSGTLVAWQGLEYLIEAAPKIIQKLPQTKFVVIGDGPLRCHLKTLALQNGVYQNFKFLGRINYREMPSYLNACDVCIIPRGKDVIGEPVKLYEYMSCAKPVVATRIDGFELIEEEKLGILVNPDNPASLADAIIELLGSPELRKQMGSRGRTLVEEKYNWSVVAGRVHEIIENVVSEK